MEGKRRIAKKGLPLRRHGTGSRVKNIMPNKLKLWAWVGLILVVVVLIALAFVWRQGSSSLQAKLKDLSPQAPGQVTAPLGTSGAPLVIGFDSDWPDGSNPQIVSSYASYYTSSSSPQQITAIYLSKLSFQDNFADFFAYFARHGWTIVNDQKNGSSTAVFNVAKGDLTSQIVIEQTVGGVRVTDSEYNPKGFTQ